jgi:hypothetical protein
MPGRTAHAVLCCISYPRRGYYNLCGIGRRPRVQPFTNCREMSKLVGDTLGRCTPAALALGDAAGRVRARVTLAGLTAALGVGLAVLGAVWDAGR